MKSPRRTLLLAVWALSMLAAVLVIAQTRFIADLSAFMPKAPSTRQQMLLDQLRDGAIARIVLLGIEGGDNAERARLSRGLVDKLAGNPLFSSIQNGDAATAERDQRYYFDNRYLLSPAIDSQRFSAAGMHQAVGDLIDDMSGDAGLIVKQILPRDPTGETLRIIDQFGGETPPRTDNGIWVSRDGQRAVLMVQLTDSGLNTDAQAHALDTIRMAFDSLPGHPAATRLKMSGTSVLSVSARNTIQGEVGRLAVVGTVLVVCLLLLIYRSVVLLLLGLVPVVSGALVGIAAVSLGFGHVHGLTLGFGTTLIGEAVDYSIYLFMQRENGSHPAGFWRTIRLGVLTSIAGFAALLCSSFPGLSQLGLYSISGLVTAALVTRYVLPVLMPANARLNDLTPIGLRLQQALDFLMRMRWLMVAAGALAALVLVVNHQSLWNRQLSALSPISKAQSALDLQLRGDLGGNDMRYVASFTAPNQESALAEAERVDAVLRPLQRNQVICGFHSPSQILPSLAAQRARQAALPDEAQARGNLQLGLAGLPLSADKLDGFLTDLRAARRQPLLTRASLAGTSSGMLLDSMLIKRTSGFLVLMPLSPCGQGTTDDRLDLNRVSAALDANGLGQVTVIDLLEETTGIFDSYTHEALLLSSLGCLTILLLLSLACGPRRAMRVALPLACAVLCVVALLHAGGVQLTILHLVGLLLVVAIGSNYALFFVSDSGGDQRKMETSLVIANLATVMSFGLLGTSSVPVLSYIGSTVAIGTLLALVFSAGLTRIRSHARHP
ncbi:MMPL family transporter [Paludibacterium purpuratum]|uniref:Putative exporter n=1 Tax=Paludibacterium purpuratum TaxID=1144873 RepID=A0A4R7B493_9NEIS|nr:MMPL family transporter [Paludibacterium purpuratum]TDR77794.1 putative exporter [Paludibacterium purpuratum]